VRVIGDERDHLECIELRGSEKPNMKALSIILLSLVTSTTALHASDCTESYRACMNVCSDKIASERCMLSCQIARKFCSKAGWRGQITERQFDSVDNPKPLRKETWGRTSNTD
jgi:hypothetical protein